MIHTLLHHLAIRGQFLCLQRLIEMHVEIDALLVQQMGKQYLRIEARRFHALLLKVLLRPFEDSANGPYLIAVCHYFTCFSRSA